MSDVSQVKDNDAEDNLDIELVDDTPEADRGRPDRKEGEEADIPDDDEIETYSERVQTRIKGLSKDFHTERRRADRESRLASEAVNFGQSMQQENERLRATLAEGENTLAVNSLQGARDSQAAAEAEYKKAYEEGDTDGVVAAQSKIARAANQVDQWERYTPQHQPQQQQPPQQVPQARPAPRQAVSNKTNDWVERNPWFNNNRRMNSYAIGFHRDLIEQQGYDPNTDEYFEAIDKEMRLRFPDHFEKEPGNDPPPPNGAGNAVDVVAAPSRTPAKRARKVTLNASEQALAKKFGLSNEQYAAQKLALQQDE